MNPAFAKKSFRQDSVPAWTCPSCEAGRLVLVDKFHVRPNAETSSGAGEEWWDHSYDEYVFNGMLNCTACGEHVSVSGTGYMSQEYTGDGDDWEYVTMLTPTFFVPPVHVISPKLNEQVPEQILRLLSKAHEICWADPDSALNRLRTIVEQILDFKGVPRTALTSGKRLSLHRRIDLFNEPGTEKAQKALLAVKYVGNDGSHGFTGIKHKDLLDVFSVVSYILEKIFPMPEIDDSHILAVVTRINTNEGVHPRRPVIEEDGV